MHGRLKFFFPDAQDLVDETFDFEREERSVTRLRQRGYSYAHQIFDAPPYDGMLISKAIVEDRYSLAQQQRLLRVGVRDFLRLGESTRTANLPVIGDCGAFSYRNQEEPPYTVEQVAAFYDQAKFTYGISVDHVILAFQPDWDSLPPDAGPEIGEAYRRRDLSIALARDFLEASKSGGFHPMGAAQGWSPKSYADSVKKLQDMGYDYIALGGLVPLKTADVLQVMEKIAEIRKPQTKLHLLGITRLDSLNAFQSYGAFSFDSTSPLVQAFKSDKDNYHFGDRTFIALRVPQVGENAKLKARILSGEVPQEEAVQAERDCLRAIKAYSERSFSVQGALDALMAYVVLFDVQLAKKPAKLAQRAEHYRETLEERPWERCPCSICKRIKHHVILFRGAERNRRRGFHNVQNFYRRLAGSSSAFSAQTPANLCV